ncbi:MAG: ATP-binding cassette domain-containing protein [Rickettsiales bacterium]
MTLLSVENLTLSFGNSLILRGISFSVEKGEMLAIVGESGSGKSLTALSCLGLQPANAKVRGSISFGGKELINIADFKKLRGKNISMIFQEPMTRLTRCILSANR